jgi:hypothetical protein
MELRSSPFARCGQPWSFRRQALLAGDLLAIAGTEEALEAARRLLEPAEPESLTYSPV